MGARRSELRCFWCDAPRLPPSRSGAHTRAPALRSYGKEWGVGLIRDDYPTTVEGAIAEVRTQLAAMQPAAKHLVGGSAAGGAPVDAAATTYRASFAQSLASPEQGLAQAFKVPRSGI